MLTSAWWARALFLREDSVVSPEHLRGVRAIPVVVSYLVRGRSERSEE
jgi:hypothetical protein